MRGAESVLGSASGCRAPAGPAAPQAFGVRPKIFAPHPPLVSGGWYQCDDREVAGPGRYPVPRPPERSALAALLWTTACGPLGLCYLSVAGGLIAAAVSVGVVIVAGTAAAVAVLWPVSMVLSLLVWHGTGRPAS
ncbi:hypothetical protein [Amycolatopsis sp. CA-230715]|uniref:hypothetical protein n=1 Tax=Amycolatopsis sp. CA-230715 TaxID=2745196 RepID=UPI001C00AE8D|nr:hypothetical protein [Amycolatopsis sp. CA-230715]QWF80431.1 hypothetical protein HUW46_03852 [Amycolatopsis sp. CA-230715]